MIQYHFVHHKPHIKYAVPFGQPQIRGGGGALYIDDLTWLVLVTLLAN
jgi:hypothetical protein